MSLNVAYKAKIWKELQWVSYMVEDTSETYDTNVLREAG